MIMINNYTLMESIPERFLYLYIFLFIINLIAFLCMFIDKRRAVLHRWRISEATLILLALFGGSLGVLFGMIAFHHKTKKLRFVFGIPFIILIQFLLICYGRALI